MLLKPKAKQNKALVSHYPGHKDIGAGEGTAVVASTLVSGTRPSKIAERGSG